MMRVISQVVGSNSLVRYGPLVMFFEGCLLLIAMGFWADASMGASGFQPTIWGDFAYSFPAKAWAAIMMAGSAIILSGLMRPPRKWMVVIGATLQLVEFGGAAYSAIFTGGELVIGIFASTLFVPFHIWLLYEAVRYGSEYVDTY